MKPIKYRVLLLGQMSAADKDAVLAQALLANSGPEAELASFRQVNPGQFVNSNWQYEVLDQRGRVGVLKYKGIEVAVYFKRQVGEVEPLPIDPVPEGVLKDPADAWVRLDLTGQSARQSSGRLSKQKKSAEEALILAQQELSVKQQIIDGLETDKFHSAQEIEKLSAEVARLKAALKAPVAGPLATVTPIRIPTPNVKARRLRK